MNDDMKVLSSTMVKESNHIEHMQHTIADLQALAHTMKSKATGLLVGHVLHVGKLPQSPTIPRC